MISSEKSASVSDEIHQNTISRLELLKLVRQSGRSKISVFFYISIFIYFIIALAGRGDFPTAIAAGFGIFTLANWINHECGLIDKRIDALVELLDVEKLSGSANDK